MGYTERHHIVPRFCGGSNEASNLVRLTARNHFIAHLLLVKFVKKRFRRKAAHALWMMSMFTNVRGNARYKLTPSQFALARRLKAAANNIGGRNFWTEESYRRWNLKMRIHRILNPPWNKGSKMPIEICERVSVGTKKAMARPEVKIKMKGVAKSSKHKKALSVAAFNRPTKRCPHCGLTCQVNMYARWHGDKCKEK